MKFFFNTLIHNEFFFSSMRLQIIFSPSNILQDFFFCVDGVEKVGIPLLLLATLAAVLFNSNRGSILAFVQFNSTAEQMRSVANVPNNPFVMHSYLTLSCLSHLFYLCTEDHNRLYCLHICKLLNSLIFIKRHLSTLSFFVTVLLLVCVRFIWSSYFVS